MCIPGCLVHDFIQFLTCYDQRVDFPAEFADIPERQNLWFVEQEWRLCFDLKLSTQYTSIAVLKINARIHSLYLGSCIVVLASLLSLWRKDRWIALFLSSCCLEIKIKKPLFFFKSSNAIVARYGVAKDKTTIIIVHDWKGLSLFALIILFGECFCQGNVCLATFSNNMAVQNKSCFLKSQDVSVHHILNGFENN